MQAPTTKCTLCRPSHERSCCELLTIRLDAHAFSPNRDQRRVERKFNGYLAGAALAAEPAATPSSDPSAAQPSHTAAVPTNLSPAVFLGAAAACHGPPLAPTASPSASPTNGLRSLKSMAPRAATISTAAMLSSGGLAQSASQHAGQEQAGASQSPRWLPEPPPFSSNLPGAAWMDASPGPAVPAEADYVRGESPKRALDSDSPPDWPALGASGAAPRKKASFGVTITQLESKMAILCRWTPNSPARLAGGRGRAGLWRGPLRQHDLF